MNRRKRKQLKQQAEAETHNAKPKKKRKKKYPQSKPPKARKMICCNCNAINSVPKHHFLRATAPKCSKCLGPLRRAKIQERKRPPKVISSWTVPAGTRVYYTADGWVELRSKKVFTEQPSELGDRYCFKVGTQYMRVNKDLCERK